MGGRNSGFFKSRCILDHFHLPVQHFTLAESKRPLTRILLTSIAIYLLVLSRYLCRSMPSSWQKVVYTPPTCNTIGFLFVSRHLCRSIRVRSRWNTPNNGLQSIEGQAYDLFLEIFSRIQLSLPGLSALSPGNDWRLVAAICLCNESVCSDFVGCRWRFFFGNAALVLSGPLNRLNAILSLLQPLDRYRAPSAIGSAIGRPYLALSRFHAQVGALNRLVLNRFRGSTAR